MQTDATPKTFFSNKRSKKMLTRVVFELTTWGRKTVGANDIGSSGEKKKKKKNNEVVVFDIRTCDDVLTRKEKGVSIGVRT